MLRSAGFIFPSGWAGCTTYTNQRIAHGLWSLYTGGVGIGTRDFRLTMACSGHPTILYSSGLSFSRVFHARRLSEHSALTLKGRATNNSNNTLLRPGSNLLFKHQATTDSNSRLAKPPELTADDGTVLSLSRQKCTNFHSAHT